MSRSPLSGRRSGSTTSSSRARESRIGGIGQTGDYSIDCRFNRAELTKKIERLAAHRDQITISNVDGRQLLQRLNRRAPAKILVNIDPPYYLKGRELYKNWYRDHDHTLLAATVSRIKPLWIVTYDDTPETRALYGKHRCFNQLLNYSAQVKRIGVELLVLDKRLRLPDAYRDVLMAA